MAMSTMSGAARSSASKRRLKDISEPVRLKTSAEMLAEKKELLAPLRVQHDELTAAAAADFQAQGFSKYDRDLKAQHDGLARQIDRVDREVMLLNEQSKADVSVPRRPS